MAEQTGIIMQTPSQFMPLFRKRVSLRNPFSGLVAIASSP
ncbi:hypothetical protein N44_01005 [Microcystis aeruginosa NIES-44]|uniref:Uncharacterized protein n=1 Tax=Microcystis aeruginosa NIES-44 TaxID=449439 RepID=A0A0A1VRM9_MICAE|nr:hypothetical protein N44_01005 [Microcystis aeruginosa NIES-44]